MIEIHAAGESRPLVETPDGVAEPQNRYVLIEEMVSLQELERRGAERRARGDTIVC